MKDKIVITGANGFIGRYLTEYLSQHNYEVVALIHKNYKFAVKGVEYRQFDMDSFSGDIIPEDTKAIIHCAYIPFKQGHKTNERNFKATQRLIKISRIKHVSKFVFLSSFSAFPDALSHYGKNKYEIEQIFDENTDLILRPALVKGSGGLWKNMQKLIDNNRFIPLIGNGIQPVQTVDIRVLAEVIKVGIEKNISGFYNIADQEAFPIKQLYKSMSSENQKANFFIPIPYFVSILIVKFFALISDNPPITKENLLGLKQMKARKPADIKAVFGIDNIGF